MSKIDEIIVNLTDNLLAGNYEGAYGETVLTSNAVDKIETLIKQREKAVLDEVVELVKDTEKYLENEINYFKRRGKKDLKGRESFLTSVSGLVRDIEKMKEKQNE